jgi:hypothetical protein
MDDSILRSQLRDPQIPDTDVLPLGEDRYSAPGEGEHGSVYERRYALFPQVPGPMEIEPLVFEGWARDDAARAAGFPPRERPVYTTSRSLRVDVLPSLSSEDDAVWLPARSITLAESGPETYRVTAGQPLVRRISLRADGLLSRSLPALSFDVPYQLTQSRQQPRLWDERRPQGVIGTRQEVITLTAHEPGYYRLPAIGLKWWSTDGDRWETARLPARNLVVTPGAFTDVGDAPPSETHTLERWPTPDQGNDQVAARTPEAQTTRQPVRQRLPEDEDGGSILWFWVAAAFALAWLATAAAWWSTRRRAPGYEAQPGRAEDEAVMETADPLAEIIGRVRSAYEASDAAGAREAFLDWGGKVLPDGPPSNLARLAQRCPEPLRTQILTLEQAFFSPQPVHWERQRVWEHMRDFQPLPAEEPASFRRPKPLRRRAAVKNAS